MALYEYEHSETSTAPAAAIWPLWADTARWPEWDAGFGPQVTSDTPDAMRALARLAEAVTSGASPRAGGFATRTPEKLVTASRDRAAKRRTCTRSTCSGWSPSPA